MAKTAGRVSGVCQFNSPYSLIARKGQALGPTHSTFERTQGMYRKERVHRHMLGERRVGTDIVYKKCPFDWQLCIERGSRTCTEE